MSEDSNKTSNLAGAGGPVKTNKTSIPNAPNIPPPPKAEVKVEVVGDSLKLKLKNVDLVQVDSETKAVWVNTRVIETPITAFVRSRLGKTLEEASTAEIDRAKKDKKFLIVHVKG
jgi:hypothetical protein